MPSPSTQDQQATNQPAPKSAAGLFESSPAHGAALEDTRPFSLLNALLADVPNAVHYQAPPFQSLPEPDPEVEVEPSAGQLAAALLKGTGPRDPMPVSEVADEKAALDAGELVLEAKELRATDDLPEADGKPERVPKARSSWPQRGFLSQVVRPKPSTDPLDKAIRIFESLSKDGSEKVVGEEDAKEPTTEAPRKERSFVSQVESVAVDSLEAAASPFTEQEASLVVEESELSVKESAPKLNPEAVLEESAPLQVEDSVSPAEAKDLAETFVSEKVSPVEEIETPNEWPSIERPLAEEEFLPEIEQAPDSIKSEATAPIETLSESEPVAKDSRQHVDDLVSERPTAPIEDQPSGIAPPQAGPVASPFTQVAPAGEPIAKEAMPFHQWPVSEVPVVSSKVGIDELSGTDALTEKEEIDPADQPTAPISLKVPPNKPPVPSGGFGNKPVVMDDEAVTQAIQLRGPIAPPPRPPAPPAMPSQPVSPPEPPQAEVAKTSPSVSPGQNGPRIAVRGHEKPASAWSSNAARVFLNNTEIRQESVNDKVASLLDILEHVLPDSENGGSEETLPKKSTGKPDPSGQATSQHEDAKSKEATRPYEVPPAPKPKSKFVPSTLEDKGDFDITAPVTVVPPSTPVSPFTKVAAGSTKDVRPTVPPSQPVSQRTKAPQVPPATQASGSGMPPSAEQAPFEPTPYPTAASPPRLVPTADEEAAESANPFSVIDKEARVAAVTVKPNPDFASPFSSAMKKNVSVGEQVGSGISRKAGPKARIAPLSENAGDEAGQTLPPPTYSFSALDTASVREQAPEGPADEPASVGDGHIRPGSRRQSVPTIEQEAEKPTWGFLTIVLGCICAIFLVLYIIEVYEQLRLPPRPAPIPPDAEDVVNSGQETASIAEPLVPIADVNLSEPLDAIKGFLNASTVEGRLPFILEGSSVAEAMRRHYASFGGLDEPLPDTIALVGDSLPDAKPKYVIFRLHWKDYAPLNIRLISQDDGSHRFSWYAFEQWRHQLLERFVVGEWSEWSHFYVQIRPGSAPSTLSEDESAKYLWYEVTSAERIGYTTTACVPLDSPLAKEFTNSFQGDRNYEVVLQLERLLDSQNKPLDYLLIVRRLSDSWESSN